MPIPDDDIRALKEWVDPEIGGTLPREHRNTILALLKEREEYEEDRAIRRLEWQSGSLS